MTDRPSHLRHAADGAPASPDLVAQWVSVEARAVSASVHLGLLVVLTALIAVALYVLSLLATAETSLLAPALSAHTSPAAAVI